MQIKWLRTALNNLDTHASYIADKNPYAAQLAVENIIANINLLATHPKLGRPGRINNTRELIIPDSRFIIPYRIRPRLKRIEILRVFHSAQKPPIHW